MQLLQKKQQHFEITELKSHGNKVTTLLSKEVELEEMMIMAATEIQERCERLRNLWKELNNASVAR